MDGGILVVVSGPSGSGKGSVLKKVVESFNGKAALCVSATTRKPREGEKNGVHYYFLSDEAFKSHIEGKNMLEYNSYCGSLYGTLRSEIYGLLEKNEIVFAEVDVNGAEKIGKCLECVKIFILPPNLCSLKQRLKLRGSETDESLNKRLKEACLEVEKAEFYDYLVENDDFEKAVLNFKSILIAEMQKMDRVKFKLDMFLKS